MAYFIGPLCTLKADSNDGVGDLLADMSMAQSMYELYVLYMDWAIDKTDVVTDTFVHARTGRRWSSKCGIIHFARTAGRCITNTERVSNMSAATGTFKLMMTNLWGLCKKITQNLYSEMYSC